MRASKYHRQYLLLFMTCKGLTHTLLLRTLCSLGDFASMNILLLKTLCSLGGFASQNILILIMCCSLERFSLQHSLLLRTLNSLEHFAPQHTLLPWNIQLPGTLGSQEHSHTARWNTIFSHIYLLVR